jgi:hypothetical protein
MFGFIAHPPTACKRILPDREPVTITDAGVNWSIKSWGRDFNENYLNNLQCYWKVTWDPKKLVSEKPPKWDREGYTLLGNGSVSWHQYHVFHFLL